MPPSPRVTSTFFCRTVMASPSVKTMGETSGLPCALNVSEIDFGQHVALAHTVALFDAGGEAFAAEFNGIHADVDENLTPVVAGEAVSVAGREGNGDGAAVWCDDGAVARFDGDTVAHAFRGKALVINILNGKKAAAHRRNEGFAADELCGRRGGRVAFFSGTEAALADEAGEDEGYDDGGSHGEGKGLPELRVDGEDAGDAADADTECLHAAADGDDGGGGRTDHAADKRETVFEVDAEQRRFGNAEVGGDAGGHVHLRGARVVPLQDAHGKHAGTLRDVGEGNHRPEDGAAEFGGERHVDGVGHVVQTGHDHGRVEETEDGGEEDVPVGGQAVIDDIGDAGTDFPADRADEDVSDDHRRHQRTEGHDDHGDNSRGDAAEEAFEIDQHEARHDGGDDLPLIADHVDAGEAEVPMRDVRRGGTRDGKGVQQLRRDKRRAEDDAEDGGGAHFARNRPDDADGQHMEDGLADEPEELVHPRPEDGGLRQRLAVEHFDFADEVAEAEDEAAADERGDDRRENFAEGAHYPLQPILLRGRRRFHRILGNAFNPGKGGEFLIKLAHLITDNHLELPGLGKRPLDTTYRLNAGNIRLFRIDQHKTHPRHAMRHRADVLLAANRL